jgi:hypothetical protein
MLSDQHADLCHEVRRKTLAAFLVEPELRLIAQDALSLIGIQLDQADATATRLHDVDVRRHHVGVLGHVQGPHKREHQTGDIRVSGLLDDASAKLADHPPERRRAKGKDVQHRLDQRVVVEELEAGQLAELMPDRHLADGRRPEDDHQFHRHMVPVTQTRCNRQFVPAGAAIPRSARWPMRCPMRTFKEMSGPPTSRCTV